MAPTGRRPRAALRHTTYYPALPSAPPPPPSLPRRPAVIMFRAGLHNLRPRTSPTFTKSYRAGVAAANLSSTSSRPARTTDWVGTRNNHSHGPGSTGTLEDCDLLPTAEDFRISADAERAHALASANGHLGRSYLYGSCSAYDLPCSKQG